MIGHVDTLVKVAYASDGALDYLVKEDGTVVVAYGDKDAGYSKGYALSVSKAKE